MNWYRCDFPGCEKSGTENLTDEWAQEGSCFYCPEHKPKELRIAILSKADGKIVTFLYVKVGAGFDLKDPRKLEWLGNHALKTLFSTSIMEVK